jgi:hypothetical protein
MGTRKNNGVNMIDISFEINGKKVDPDKIGDALEVGILKEIIESITESVGSVRCQKHGGTPRIVCKGGAIESLSLEVSGCCDGLTKIVKKRLED